MVATFCLRLAAGLDADAADPAAPADSAPLFPRPFSDGARPAGGGRLFSWRRRPLGFWLFFATRDVGCLVGSIVWHLDEAPGGTAVSVVDADRS